MAIDERIDRTAFHFTTFDEAEGEDIDYWLSKTPAERFEAVEYLRRWAYGEDQVNARLQRVFEFDELGED